MKFLGNNNNGGFGQSVGGAQSGVGPIEFSVCIVLTNQKPVERAQGVEEESNALYFRECSNSKTRLK